MNSFYILLVSARSFTNKIVLLTASSIFLLCFQMNSQNEHQKWYFGFNAGLDFMTSPPTILTNGALNSVEASASISDASGNLLFYTDGETIWNKNHLTMANGSGLAGNMSSAQGAVIVKKPGSSTEYYIFTQSGPVNSSPVPGLCYSIVDMNLAAQMGSVTVKNASLATNCVEALTIGKNCNGSDYWILVRNYPQTFQAFLLTASGINTPPVTSVIGTTYTAMDAYACSLKLSPNGKKLAASIFWINNPPASSCFELFDFDASTGLITNSLSLASGISGAYGCEFSPNGTKVYLSTVAGIRSIYQWDLCAGNATNVIASQHTVYTGTGDLADMQRAKNGKIYITEPFVSSLHVINAPDLAGSACSFVQSGQSIAPKNTLWSLPDFVCSSTPPIVPFTYSESCGNVTFTSNHASQNVLCQSSSYSLTNVLWLFGDAAASGSLNTSSAFNPVHYYSSNGTYSVQMISYYSCGGGTDTVKLNVNVSSFPTIAVLGNTNICIGENRTYTASGADSYSWSSGATTQSVLLNPTVNTVYTVSGTSTLTGCSTSKTFTINVAECTSVEKTNKVNSLKIYPNPFNSNLTLETENSVLLQFINQLGETVIECSFDSGKHSVDLSNFNAGIYTLKYTDKTGTRGRLLVKFD